MNGIHTTSVTFGRDSSSTYFKWFREEVFAAIPADAKCILSVGCAAGVTEAELVRRGIKVVGIEINPHAAKLARDHGIIVLEGDASQIDVNVVYAPYDCIIYADILEHLSDPLAVLKRHIKSLKPGGIVYVCVPNFRHYSVFWKLFVQGNVHYMKDGILDRTHLRITTRKMVQEWFQQAGLELVRYRYLIWGRRNRLISQCLFGLAKEFIANQVELIARKSLDCSNI
jgi:2-polyprenyl-3-methyl-5-hydroxy-6-metoxy-1,4-benzoquinol methylase